MADLLGTAGGAAVLFAATNIDDIVILTVLFVAARSTGRPRPWQIVAGQYLGIGVLTLAAVIVAAGLLVVPEPWTGLLGLLPTWPAERPTGAAGGSGPPDRHGPAGQARPTGTARRVRPARPAPAGRRSRRPRRRRAAGWPGPA
ncbi:cadmium resistance transporter [Micromonospora fluostatini]|uniref:cadmium resistance transporter n=1 Tax=Micromonospora sp. JCM 30529 TaxID=3421643 RepID=UPI003D16F19C